MYVQDLEDQKAGKKDGPKNYKRTHNTSYEEKYLIRPGYWKDTPGSTSTATATATATGGNARTNTSALTYKEPQDGKYKIGGYRAMHGLTK